MANSENSLADNKIHIWGSIVTVSCKELETGALRWFDYFLFFFLRGLYTNGWTAARVSWGRVFWNAPLFRWRHLNRMWPACKWWARRNAHWEQPGAARCAAGHAARPPCCCSTSAINIAVFPDSTPHQEQRICLIWVGILESGEHLPAAHRPAWLQHESRDKCLSVRGIVDGSFPWMLNPVRPAETSAATGQSGIDLRERVPSLASEPFLGKLCCHCIRYQLRGAGAETRERVRPSTSPVPPEPK